MAFATAYSSTFLQFGYGINKTQKIRLIPKAPPCVRVWAKDKSLLEKAQAGKFKCLEDNCTRCYDSRNALTDHLIKDHNLPRNTPAKKLCTHCGYPKGNEEKCKFLAPHDPPCAAIAKLSRKQSQAIHIQQYRDNNK